MKLMTKIAAVGGLLVLNGAMAFAQSEIKLDVPFGFAVSNTQMPAGRYYITDVNGARTIPYFRVQHAETGKSALAVSTHGVDRKSRMGRLLPQVAFLCAGSNCALSAVYPVGMYTGRAFPVKKLAPKNAQVATIVIPATAE